MNTCILHFGMHKTGSSSIQESLWLNLRDPNFRYVEVAGHPNGCQFMNAVFLHDPRSYWVYQKQALSREKAFALKDRFRRRLRNVMRRLSGTGITPILSAEACWNFAESEWVAIRDFMREEKYNMRIVIYLRPIKSWIESMIQEHSKFDSGFTMFSNLGEKFCLTQLNYMQRLLQIESIFGRENMLIRVFKKSELIDGCAVSDFCKVNGIAFNPDDIKRSNEGVCADAVRMLQCYHNFFRGSLTPSLAANQLLIMRLKDLKGDAFHLHSSCFVSIRDHILTQNEVIQGRYGVDLQEDLEAYDEVPCVRDASEMLQFSRQSLEWLAQASNLAVIHNMPNDLIAQSVAKQMNELLRQPMLKLRFERLRQGSILKLLEIMP
jgi:hypothetical protein